MKKEQSLLRIFCPENICVGEPFKVLVDLDFTHATQIISLTGFFEGKFRTTISSQVEYRQITAFRIEFDALLRQWRTHSGKIRAPAGHYRAESRIVIGAECPGSYSSKNGCIEYLTAVKLRIAGRIGHSELAQIRAVNVVPLVDITPYLSFRVPVYVEKCFHKKIFCFNKSSASILVELPKAAFVRGEEITICGEVGNEHPSNPIKGGLVELVMIVRFRCKGSEKYTNVTLSHFALPAIPPCSISAFDHCLQVPDDAFPTYAQPNALISSSYHISVTISECPSIEIPVIIGTGSPARTVRLPRNLYHQPSLLSIAGHTKVRPLPPRPRHQPLPQLLSAPSSPPPHPPPLPPPHPPLPPPYFRPRFGRGQLDKSHFVQPCLPLPFHHHPQHHYRGPRFQSQTIFPQKEQPPTTTRYEGQSVLKIEEIE